MTHALESSRPYLWGGARGHREWFVCMGWCWGRPRDTCLIDVKAQLADPTVS